MIRPSLEKLFCHYHRSSFLSTDPLEYPRRYTDSLDQEIVALLSALLAYGRVAQIRLSLEKALALIHDDFQSPREWVESLSAPSGFRGAVSKFSDFVHRFNTGFDLVLFSQAIGKVWKEYGTLGILFCSQLNSEDVTIQNALSKTVRFLRRLVPLEHSPSVNYFFTDPLEGSACKRWCMFLRWMGRKDEIDLGTWQFGLDPAQLIVPLDTHVARVSQLIGLTTRKSPDWKMALEVTESLRAFEPDDPTKYDFALARLGITEKCVKRFERNICGHCQLETVCTYARAIS